MVELDELEASTGRFSDVEGDKCRWHFESDVPMTVNPSIVKSRGRET